MMSQASIAECPAVPPVSRLRSIEALLSVLGMLGSLQRAPRVKFRSFRFCTPRPLPQHRTMED